ncbi:hypothetical protein RCL1_001255 [Eukaryota sp. TZLM3-RCL]
MVNLNSLPDPLLEEGIDVPQYRSLGFLPVIGTSGDIRSSKFGGLPYLPEGIDAPKYKDQFLPLALQLDVSSLPDDAQQYLGLTKGHIQLFYSPELEEECDGWEHDNGGCSLVRYFENTGEHVPVENLASEFMERFIEKWEPFVDYMNAEEGDYYDNEKLMDAISGKFPVAKDKLMGSAYWVQSVEYSDCKKCGCQKVHVFHVESEQNLDFMFGDSGAGQLQQCPNCVTEFSFGWACC